MSVVHINNQEAYFIGFQGIGVCFTVVDGKLVLGSPGKNDTVESALNDFVDSVRDFIKERRSDLRKTAAISPLISFLKDADGGGMPPDMAKEILSAMADTDVRCRTAITEAEDLLLDVTDLMIKYNVTVRSGSGDKRSSVNGVTVDKLKSILAKLTGNQ